MYINPFLAGVLATVFVELAGLVIFSVINVSNRGKHHD